MNLERAIEIAVTAHKGQIDKAGSPYILHPLRVMLSLSTEDERIVGVLHDVVEDTYWTFDALKSEGLRQALIEALASVTVNNGEDYSSFIARAALNPIGRRVKIADLTDNMDLSRIANPSERDFERIEKYKRALATLTDEAT